MIESNTKLELRCLSKCFETKDGTIVATDNLSLSIKSGQFTAVVGRSGAGKSTLFNIICGLQRPDSGRIILDGNDITSLSDNEFAKMRRSKIGVIHQFYNLIPELNVRENITLPVILDKKPVDEDKLALVIDKVGLTGRERSFPSMLSGGQQQRVAIARAIYCNPEILLADEPTGNLDLESTKEVLDLIMNINREYGITVIMITHSAEIAAKADRIITIENGRIINETYTYIR